MKNIAIFASGTGSNATKIIDHFRNHDNIKVVLVVCNNPSAKVLDIADENEIPTLLITKERFFNGDGFMPKLEEKQVDFIVLAGFLWKIPHSLLEAYPNHIINIHPALLPNYGGKGMYGLRVHESVISHKEKESGITIHYVDEKYDNGDIIFQATCPVMEDDTAASLAKRVSSLEHRYFAGVIEKMLSE